MKHANKDYAVTSPSLRAKVGAAAVSGCLALAMLPAMAFADVPEGATGNNMPPAMQETTAQGQAGQAFGGFGQDMNTMQGPGAFQGIQPGGMNQGQFEMPQAPTNNESNTFEAAPQAPSNMQAPWMQGQAPAAPSTTEQADGSASSNERPAAPSATQDASTSGTEIAEQRPSAPSAPGNTTPAPSSENQAMPNNATTDQAPAAMNQGMPRSENEQRIINAIDNEEIRNLALGGNKDIDNKRPPIPEGEINVAQLVDSIHDTVFGNKVAPFVPNTPSATDNASATTPRGNSTEAASVNTATNTNTNTQENASAPSAEKPMQAPLGDDTSSLPLFQQIFNSVVAFFQNLFK